MKKVPFFIFILFCWMALQAQPKPEGIIMGSLFDSVASKPMQGATLVLRLMHDTSAYQRTQVTGADGFFNFTSLPMGYFSLSVSSVGFASLTLDSIYLRPDRYDFNLGDLKMGYQTSELQQVVVYVEKPMLESKDGRVTFNAGESALSAGSTTADLLRNLPLVSSDPNGKILLRGKEPRILIDDKPVDLNGQQLADLLESLPGGSIERIELLQNPPPEYGTEAGGVINIVTKKGKVGFTGRLTLSAGTRGEANTGVNVGYRTAKLNLAATINVGASMLLGYNDSYRSNFFADSTNRLITEGDFDNRNLRPNLRLQAEFDPNKRHQLSLVVQANDNNYLNESNTSFKNINRNDVLWRLSNRNIVSEGFNYNVNPQFTWLWKSKRAGESLRLITGVSSGKYSSDRTFFQQFFDAASGLPNGIDSSQQQLTRNSAFNTQTRINYNRPMGGKAITLNTGVGVLSTRNDNDLQSLYLDKTQGNWLPSPLLSNSFVFDQWVYFVRAGLTWQARQGWRLIGYVQPELTRYDLKNKTSQVGSSNRFVNWLPGLTLRKDLNKTNSLSLVYRKSIRRPTSNELNPAIDYGDPYNLRFGNPVLQPATAHNFDLNYDYTKGKSFFNAALGFNKVEDIIAIIRTLQPDGKTFVTYKNIASRKEYEASVGSGYSFSKMVRINLSAGYTYFYYTLADRKMLGYINAASFYSTLNYNFTFSGVFSVDGGLRFSSMADPQGRSRSNINSNFGVQYKFFQRRLLVSFNMIDPFTPQEYTTITTGTNFELENFRSSRTRNFRLTLGWQLNKVVSAPKSLLKSAGR